MSLFHNVRRKNANPSGKFLHVARFGTERVHGTEFRDWTYHLIRHVAGVTVRRVVYNVTISDPSGNSAAYLTDYPSPARAHAAARAWIDDNVRAAEGRYSGTNQ